MRSAPILPAIAAAVALTGCAASAGSTPTETVTVTVTPSAPPSPTPTGPSSQELSAWADDIEAKLIELNGSWQDQCSPEAKDWTCFVEDFDSHDEDILEVTMDVTAEKVPELEYELEKYKNAIGETGGRQIWMDLATNDEYTLLPDYIRFVNPDGTQIGYLNATGGPVFDWATLYPDYE